MPVRLGRIVSTISIPTTHLHPSLKACTYYTLIVVEPGQAEGGGVEKDIGNPRRVRFVLFQPPEHTPWPFRQCILFNSQGFDDVAVDSHCLDACLQISHIGFRYAAESKIPDKSTNHAPRDAYSEDK